MRLLVLLGEQGRRFVEGRLDSPALAFRSTIYVSYTSTSS
jgi:hypothetical protein